MRFVNDNNQLAPMTILIVSFPAKSESWFSALRVRRTAQGHQRLKAGANPGPSFSSSVKNQHGSRKEGEIQNAHPVLICERLPASVLLCCEDRAGQDDRPAFV